MVGSKHDLAPLSDDFQQLFVQLVLNHVLKLCQGEKCAPLRLLLLGTAGTGKTFAVQTLLHRLHTRLRELDLPPSTVRIAAPTGSAAFNMRWGATTVHRLIHWFRPPHFTDLKPHSDALLRFQEAFKHTRLLIFDEVSMIGRQMMGPDQPKNATVTIWARCGSRSAGRSLFCLCWGSGTVRGNL